MSWKRAERIIAASVLLGAMLIALYSYLHWRIVFFQAQLPLYPGAQNVIETYEGARDIERRVRTFQTADSSELVKRFYEAQFANADWHGLIKPGQLSFDRLIEQRGDRSQLLETIIAISARSGITYVEVTESRKAVFVNYSPGLNP
jgi:hypothetical protein